MKNGGETQPTALTKDNWQNLAEPVFEAKKTIRENNHHYIYFDVDDRFLNNYNKSYQLKITYLDDFEGSWWVEYNDHQNPQQKSSIISNKNEIVLIFN
ncbi:MAG: hypothetical protein OHK0053_34070 [Microscillaceae bacterium]